MVDKKWMITEGKLKHPEYLIYSYKTLIRFSPHKEHKLPDIYLKYFLLFLNRQINGVSFCIHILFWS